MVWEDEFRRRMNRFETSLPTQENGTSISIKIRVLGGCFHREHSPHAYKKIDEYLSTNPSTDLVFEEHESGPEILVWLSLVTAGVSFSANVINLVTAIIKARRDGIKDGDHPSETLELILRGFDEDGKLKEEKILKFNSLDNVNGDLIEKALLNSANQLIPKNKGKKKKISNSSTS
jgi:hypothetical protein